MRTGIWETRLNQMADVLDKNPSKADVLWAMHTLLNELRAYRSQGVADHAAAVIQTLIAERGWTEDIEPVEGGPGPG